MHNWHKSCLVQAEMLFVSYLNIPHTVPPKP